MTNSPSKVKKLPKITKNNRSQADEIMHKIQDHNVELIKLWKQWKKFTWGKGAL